MLFQNILLDLLIDGIERFTRNDSRVDTDAVKSSLLDNVLEDDKSVTELKCDCGKKIYLFKP